MLTHDDEQASKRDLPTPQICFIDPGGRKFELESAISHNLPPRSYETHVRRNRVCSVERKISSVAVNSGNLILPDTSTA